MKEQQQQQKKNTQNFLFITNVKVENFSFLVYTLKRNAKEYYTLANGVL